ncbi:Protein of unknown function DUF1664 [Macleaya cordata]|uniref:DUF1664 domain-containing protein n=1 Tax=Macleaya cordata TaxID=56857 RepID=A0A200QF68_MACCD|nr:Protein of unknown function DUF1664 [Macleaya cordata]
MRWGYIKVWIWRRSHFEADGSEVDAYGETVGDRDWSSSPLSLLELLKFPGENESSGNNRGEEGEGRQGVSLAMHAGMGFSKIIILLGAGYTGSIMMKNGRLSDILDDLQSFVKGLERSGDSSDADFSDALASQCITNLTWVLLVFPEKGHKFLNHSYVSWNLRFCHDYRVGPSTSNGYRQLSSPQQVTVLNGDSNGNIASLAMPAATLGPLGYGYMWWKGLSFSDLLYVTRHTMANAVSSMTKHLEQVSSALDVAKRHLTRRIQKLDGKVEEQKNLSEDIRNQVTVVSDDLSQISLNLDSLREVVSGLAESVRSLECKQDITNAGVLYLCNFIKARGQTKVNSLQGQPSSSPRVTGIAEALSLTGHHQIADTVRLGNTDN